MAFLVPTLSLSYFLSLAFLSPTLANPTTGCTKPLPSKLAPGKTANFTLPHSNSTSPPSDRQYHVYIPETYTADTHHPLIFSLHGRSENMMQQERISKLSQSHYNPSSIVIYPQGLPYEKRTHPRQWSGDPDSPSTVNDTIFVSELLDHFQERYCIDPSRVYATGKSNGGGMVNRLACNPSMSSRIAAFAPVSGAMYPAFEEPCTSGRRPIPMLEFHGGADKVINYSGGPDKSNRGKTVPIPTFLAHWVNRDCPNGGVTKATTQTPHGEGGDYTNKTTWSCDGHEGIVTHYFSNFLGHTWPNEENAGYEATEVIMEFFGRHSLPGQVGRVDGKKDEL